jgi:hypothetical protein
VPFMDLVGERPALNRWAESRGYEGLREYRANRNARSIDGLPAPSPDPEPADEPF